MADRDLASLGERRIVDELLRERYQERSRSFGDDCAQLPVPEASRLVITTDPCPEPMASLLGFTDLYYRGWLLATINLSDLAAAGAVPLGLVTSLILPATTPIDHLNRLLDGIDDCCEAADTYVVGGNLKEGLVLDVQATALGAVQGEPLSRTNSWPGDMVVAAGPTGAFWAAALALRDGAAPNDLPASLLATVLTPSPQLAFGQQLQRSGIRCAAMDNSDGLGSALRTLANANGVRVTLDLDDLVLDGDVMRVAGGLGLAAQRLALGWGDWNLVISFAPEDANIVEGIARATGTPITSLASVSKGSGVRVRRGGLEMPLEAPDSERFVPDSWFSAGIDSYIDRLLAFPLP